jgi:hypothetical protein
MTMRANLEAEVNRVLEAVKQAEKTYEECKENLERRREELEMPSAITLAQPDKQKRESCQHQKGSPDYRELLTRNCLTAEENDRKGDFKQKQKVEHARRIHEIEKAERSYQKAQNDLQDKREYLSSTQKRLTDFVAADSSAARTESTQTKEEVTSLKQLISVQQEQLEMMRQMIAQLTMNKPTTMPSTSKSSEQPTDTSSNTKKSTKTVAEFFTYCENDFQEFQKKVPSTTYQKAIDLCKAGTSSSLTSKTLSPLVDALILEVPYINSGTSAQHEFAELLLEKMQKLSNGIKSGEIIVSSNVESLQAVVSNAVDRIEIQLKTRKSRTELSVSSYEESTEEFKDIESKPTVQISSASHTATSLLDFPAMLLQQAKNSASSFFNIFSNYIDSWIDSAQEYATEVVQDCPSYFSKNSPHYWRNGGSHTLISSQATENALNSNGTCLLTYTPTPFLLGPT